MSVTVMDATVFRTSVHNLNLLSLRQVNGIPIGSSLSPFLADLVLNCLDTLVNERFKAAIKYWARYVDDVMAIVATDHIENTLVFLNRFHPLLKFTTENESNGFLPFLDILFENKLNYLQTTVFRNPSHSPIYLHANSFSPISHKISLTIVRNTITKQKVEIGNTKDVVYRIPCKSCNVSYIGETGRFLGTRLQEHKSSWKYAKESFAMVEHGLRSRHQPDWENTSTIYRGIQNSHQRKFLEAIASMKDPASIQNRSQLNVGMILIETRLGGRQDGQGIVIQASPEDPDLQGPATAERPFVSHTITNCSKSPKVLTDGPHLPPLGMSLLSQLTGLYIPSLSGLALERSYFRNKIQPNLNLTNITFQTTLGQSITKNQENPHILLQIISTIPPNTIKIYIDGSRFDDGSYASRVFIVNESEKKKMKFRNPNNCSNFRAELLAIEKGLTECKNSNKNIWILSDSLSDIQHIKDIDSAKDKTTTKIINILQKISQENQITSPMDPLSP
ncbi:hypothetical protein LAZ67_23000724 [Cordylochernes scorpioides]|uniref:Reverse transcriptase domain-containing protein n=1 Tax=Cordylochernes scorpioides TaxID=51811 RepID=A0ABY6LQJ2_9ARAC|nr:hypothetical protein LAZ67_23000724 [Cordylochernes scorpioides]